MLEVLKILTVLLGISQTASALPPIRRTEACTVKTQRKPWHTLASSEKASYIEATLCLMETPAKGNIPIARTRWDELQYAHISQSDYIHQVGAFLPWHRYFLKVHEQVLRGECDYKGPMPYWNETVDVDNLKGSEVFDPQAGFGGNGVATSSTRCIADGPFANYTLRLRENLTETKYCISRNINQCSFGGASQANIDACMAKENYLDAWHCLEGQPHGAGHGGVGGIMINTQLSPGDPLFYLHHSWLDRLWWLWQSKDLSTRLTAIEGPNVPIPFTFLSFGNGTSTPFGPGANGSIFGGVDMGCMMGQMGMGNGTFPFPFNETHNPFAGASPGGPNGTGGFPLVTNPWVNPNTALTHYFNDAGNVTTLNHTLWSAGILPNATIQDVMDVRGPFVCVEYI